MSMPLISTIRPPYKNFAPFYVKTVKWVVTRPMVDALSELCSPFLKGGNTAFIAAIASGLFPQNKNIGHWNNYGPNKVGSNS